MPSVDGNKQDRISTDEDIQTFESLIAEGYRKVVADVLGKAGLHAEDYAYDPSEPYVVLFGRYKAGLIIGEIFAPICGTDYKVGHFRDGKFHVFSYQNRPIQNILANRLAQEFEQRNIDYVVNKGL